MMNWKSQLRSLRYIHGIKQSVLAERLNVTQATVSRWETGKQVPELLAQRRIRDMLNQFRKRIEADFDALLGSPLAERSILDPDFVVVAASDHALTEIGANRSDIIGKSAVMLRQDPRFQRLVDDYADVMKRGDFTYTRGLFFSKRANSWVQTYTIPILLNGRIHYLSDRRTLRQQSFSDVEFTISPME